MADLFQNGRDNQQFRTLHVKSLAKYGSIQNIIENMRNPKAKQAKKDLKFGKSEEKMLKKFNAESTSFEPEIRL